MNLFSKLILSLLVAAAATATVHLLGLSTPIQLGIAIASACLVATLLGNIGASSPAPAARSGKTRSQASVETPVESADGEREEGKVKWFNVSKGFGFIVRENGEEIFVHFRSIRGENTGRRGLRDGQPVSFIVVESEKGPQAEEVIPL